MSCMSRFLVAHLVRELKDQPLERKLEVKVLQGSVHVAISSLVRHLVRHHMAAAGRSPRYLLLSPASWPPIFDPHPLLRGRSRKISTRLFFARVKLARFHGDSLTRGAHVSPWPKKGRREAPRTQILKPIHSFTRRARQLLQPFSSERPEEGKARGHSFLSGRIGEHAMPKGRSSVCPAQFAL